MFVKKINNIKRLTGLEGAGKREVAFFFNSLHFFASLWPEREALLNLLILRHFPARSYLQCGIRWNAHLSSRRPHRHDRG